MRIKNRPETILILFFIVPIVSIAIGEYSPYNFYLFNKSQIVEILIVLVTVKGPLVAIIFSALFVITQVMSSRYSPEFISVFTESNIMRYTFYIAIWTITFDIVILVLQNQFDLKLLNILFLVSLIYSVSLIWGIYPGMKHILKMLTPINILDHYVSHYSVDRFIEDSNKASKRETIAKHPIHPIYALIRNALSRDESAVALAGEQKLHQICMEMMQKVFSGGLLPIVSTASNRYQSENVEEDVLRIDVLFGPVLDRYLTEIALQAIEKNYDELYYSAVDHIGDFGEEGLEYYEPLGRMCFDIVYLNVILTIRDMDISTSRKIDLLNACIEIECKITEEMVEQGELNPYHKMHSIIYEIARITDDVFPTSGMEALRTDEATQRILNSQIHCYKSIVNSNVEYFEHLSLSLTEALGKPDERPDQWDPIEHEDLRVSALINCRVLMMAIAGLKYQSADYDSWGHRPEILIAWKEMTIFATSNPPKSLGIITAQRFIEMIVYFAMNEEKDLMKQSLASHISEVMEKGSYDIIERAFLETIRETTGSSQTFGYGSFRNQTRSGIWYPFNQSNESDGFLDDLYFIREKSIFKHRSSMKKTSYDAYNLWLVESAIKRGHNYATNLRSGLDLS